VSAYAPTNGARSCEWSGCSPSSSGSPCVIEETKPGGHGVPLPRELYEFDELIHEPRLELGSRASLQLFCSPLLADALAVRPRVRHGVIGVDYREYSAFQGYLLALQAFGIAVAVPGLMVVPNEIGDMKELLEATCQVVSDLCALFRSFEFFLGELSGLEQYLGGPMTRLVNSFLSALVAARPVARSTAPPRRITRPDPCRPSQLFPSSGTQLSGQPIPRG
jgi:hypothetical protein